MDFMNINSRNVHEVIGHEMVLTGKHHIWAEWGWGRRSVGTWLTLRGSQRNPSCEQEKWSFEEYLQPKWSACVNILSCSPKRPPGVSNGALFDKS